MAEETQSDFPAPWKPSPGDALVGTLKSVELIDPNGQGAYPCVTVETTDGERAIHAFHSVLRRELARRAPKIGDEIEVLYHGKREGGAYGSYHSYKVTGGQGQEFNWASQLPPGERVDDVPIAPAPVGQAAAERQRADNERVAAEAATDFGDKPPF